MARTGNVLLERTFEAIWPNNLPAAGFFPQHFWAMANHPCFSISNDEAPMPPKAIFSIFWRPNGSLVVRWDKFHVCWLPVKCSLHWGPLSEGLALSQGWGSLLLRRPGPLFLRLRLSLHPDKQVHVPRKHNQSMMTRSKCKHTSRRSTGCPVDYYFEIDCVWGVFI